MNDPKPFFWQGDYHVFFQHCPDVPYSAVKHWGHAVSHDLVHWHELPIALAPTPGGPDNDGCWTGCVVRDNDHFSMLYTGVHPQVQCLATSADLLTWDKHPANPVIGDTQKPAGFGDTFRDPCVWKEHDTWYAVIGGVAPGVGGAPFLFTSPDLINWEYVHPLYVGPAARDECPDFFPLAGKQVLLSSRHETAWTIGRYENLHFIPESSGTVDDSLYYAAKTLVDNHGRRILFGWIREGRSRDAYVEAGWSGVLALPRILRVLPDNTLGIEPVPELEVLRGRHWSFHDLSLSAETDADELRFEIPGGESIEVQARFIPGSAKIFGMAVQNTDVILYHRDQQELLGRPLALGPAEPLSLQIYVDRSVIEVFANGRFSQTIRTYHQPGDLLDIVRVLSQGGDLTVESLDIWEIRPESR